MIHRTRSCPLCLVSCSHARTHSREKGEADRQTDTTNANTVTHALRHVHVDVLYLPCKRIYHQGSSKQEEADRILIVVSLWQRRSDSEGPCPVLSLSLSLLRARARSLARSLPLFSLSPYVLRHCCVMGFRPYRSANAYVHHTYAHKRTHRVKTLTRSYRGPRSEVRKTSRRRPAPRGAGHTCQKPIPYPNSEPHCGS